MKAIIVDSSMPELDGVREELVDWARSLGANVKKATSLFILAQDDRGGWQAHFSIKRGPEGNPDGPDLIVPGANRVQVDYGCTVIDVEQASWPSWFPAADDVPDLPVSALLEVLDVAKAANLELRFNLRGRDRLGW